MSLRVSDSLAEKQISIFLDKYFYPKYYPRYQRVTELDLQLKGIDTILDISGTSLLCDEKAAIHYVNRGLPTFAFEIDFRLPNGNLVDGWFISGDKKTQLYLLSWVWASKDKGFTAEDIIKLEIIVISRQQLVEELFKLDITEKTLKSKSQEIRSSNMTGAIEKNENPFYFYLTTRLNENPLNLIIKKNFLIKNSLLHTIIVR
jgi:hypothetical protein